MYVNFGIRKKNNNILNILYKENECSIKCVYT